MAELEKKIDALTASLNAQNKDGSHVKNVDRMSSEETGHAPPLPAASVSHEDPHGARDWVERVGRRESATRHADYSTSYTAPGIKRRRLSDEQGQYPESRSIDPSLQSSASMHVANPAAAMPPVDPTLSSHVHQSRPTTSVGNDSTPTSGLIDKQIDAIVDRATATKIFNHYVTNMAEHLPAVVFESGTTAADVRAQKPFLFLTILVAASVGMADLKMQHNLSHMALGVFADAIIRHGEKSLELVQALMVSAIWYRPPKRYEQMNFYQLTHIAAIMAIEIGMGKKLSPSKTWRMQSNDNARAQKHIQASDTVEARRTWLGCYFLCAK